MVIPYRYLGELYKIVLNCVIQSTLESSVWSSVYYVKILVIRFTLTLKPRDHKH